MQRLTEDVPRMQCQEGYGLPLARKASNRLRSSPEIVVAQSLQTQLMLTLLMVLHVHGRMSRCPVRFRGQSKRRRPRAGTGCAATFDPPILHSARAALSDILSTAPQTSEEHHLSLSPTTPLRRCEETRSVVIRASPNLRNG